MNYRSFQINIDIQNIQGNVEDLINDITNEIKKINPKSYITLLKLNTVYIFIVETKLNNLTRREKAMLDSFSFITNYNCEYSIFKLNQKDIKENLMKCYSEGYTLIDYPKYLVPR